MSETILKSAVVKVMLSHNYNHFEASIALENETGLTVKEIDEARKNCNRLCNKAVKQYQIAKEIEDERIHKSYAIKELEREVEGLNSRPENTLSPEEKAKVKSLEDYYYRQSRWDFDDDEDEF